MTREFESVEEFETWLKIWCVSHMRETNCVFSALQTAKVLPILVEEQIDASKIHSPHHSLDLAIIRATLVSLVTPFERGKKLIKAARSAKNTTFEFLQNSAHALAVVNAAFSSTDAVISSSNFAIDAERSVRHTVNSIIHTATGFHEVLSSTYDTALSLEEHGEKATVETGLWGNRDIPVHIGHNWKNLRKTWQTTPEMSFWIDWYEGLLQGRTPDWDLWHDIVLIEDKAWESGPEAIAREIHILQAAQDLDEAILRLEAELLVLAKMPLNAGNRHNGGPELETPSERLDAIKLIQEQLDILKTERNKAKPDIEGTPDPTIIESTLSKILALFQTKLGICLTAASLALATVTTTALTQVTSDGLARYEVSDKLFDAAEDFFKNADKFLESLKGKPTPPQKPTSSSTDTPLIDL